MPDGCVDVIWIDERPPFVAGPMTAAIQFALDPGTELVGVRLRPGVAHRLLAVSAKELLNRHVPLRDLWPQDRALDWEDVMAREALPARLDAVGVAITDRLGAMRDSDGFVTRAATWLARHPYGRIEEVSRLFGLSERQMRRTFDLAFGYGPKQFQRIMRLQYLLWLASRDRSPHPNLARLAAAAGYTDQPHMTREVGALAGVSPGQLLFGTAPRSAVSELFQSVAAHNRRLMDR